MTYEEAKAAAIAAGIPPAQVTAEDLRLFGYEVGDPTGGLTPVVAVDPKKVKDDLGLLQAEAQSNQWSAVALGALTRIIGFAAKALIPAILFCLFLNGCASTQATHSVEMATISVQALNQGHLDFEEAFVQQYRLQESNRIDELYLAAVKSHTQQIQTTIQAAQRVRTVGADGKTISETTETVPQVVTSASIDPQVADALVAQKAKLFQQLEANVISMRKKQALICQNAANASAYLEGLAAYFKGQAMSFEAMNQTSNALMDFLDKFVTSKTGK